MRRTSCEYPTSHDTGRSCQATGKDVLIDQDGSPVLCPPALAVSHPDGGGAYLQHFIQGPKSSAEFRSCVAKRRGSKVHVFARLLRTCSLCERVPLKGSYEGTIWVPLKGYYKGTIWVPLKGYYKGTIEFAARAKIFHRRCHVCPWHRRFRRSPPVRMPTVSWIGPVGVMFLVTFSKFSTCRAAATSHLKHGDSGTKS